MSTATTTTVADALALLHEPGEVFEVRIFGVKGAGTVSGYFNDPALAAAAIAGYDGDAEGIYHTINPVDPALLERAPNRLREKVGKGGCTEDKNIICRRWLPVDVDFKRSPAKSNANEDELKAAMALGKQIRVHLETELEWPASVKVASGNGAHLLYRIDLPKDDSSRSLCERVLKELAAHYGDPAGAHVDTSVHNAARIMKVPGTMVRKGPSSEERPYRRSRILGAPEDVACVLQSTLEAFAPPEQRVPLLTPAQQSAAGNGNGLKAWTVKDVEDRLAAWGREVRNHTIKSGGVDVWELKVCPLNPEHDRGEPYVLRRENGAMAAGCHHESCTWSWEDFRSWYDPEYATRSATARTPAAKAPPAAVLPVQVQSPSVDKAPSVFLDWSTFWARDHSEAEWVYPDVLARGRGHALYATHKAGKSLLMLYIAAALATGSEPIVVVYFDYEMTEADVFDRLEDMGHGPDTDFSRLRYALLPTLPPLDTAAGAEALTALVDGVQAEWQQHHLVVVIDTISRAVCGEENSADTFRDFYAHTGIQLKRRGITWARLDHSGKDTSQGQRGSSGKGDDVDVVWELTLTQNGVCLKRKLARMSWVPEQVLLGLFEEPLRYVPLAKDWPAGTVEVAAELDRLDLPLTVPTRVASDAIKAANSEHRGRRRGLVLAAIRWRIERAKEGS